MGTTHSGGKHSVAVVIPAAGSGNRMGDAGNKMLLRIGDMSVIERTARLFVTYEHIDRVVVAVLSRDFGEFEQVFASGNFDFTSVALVKGGKVRQDSVWRGIAALKDTPPDWVLIHDGARPFCSPQLLGRVLEALESHSAVVPVLPLTDTVRKIGSRGPSKVLDRETLHRSQTPQGFHWDVLCDAFLKAKAAKREGTDDAQLVEAAGHRIHFVRGEEENIKITNPEDLTYAHWVSQGTICLGGN